jgi:hypothetical protein
MNVLKQYNLTNRPSVMRASDAKEGVVIHFVRKLPTQVFKRPRNVSGYETMKRNREEEFEPELPVEGEGEAMVEAETAAAAAMAPPMAMEEGAAEATGLVVDKRHTADIDRAAIMAKLRGVTRTSALAPPSFSSSFAIGDVRRPELEPGAGAGAGAGEAVTPGTAAIKLGKRAILPSDDIPKQSRAAAAVAITEVNKPGEFDEMRGDAEATEATEAPPKKKKTLVIRPKPKSAAASGSVSAAAVSTKAAVKKIKEREDSTVNIAAYKVGDTIVATRLPAPRALPQVQASDFYMNNRARFIQYINALFRPYRDELTSGENDISCEALYGGDDSASVALLTHQKIVRDYLNI